MCKQFSPACCSGTCRTPGHRSSVACSGSGSHEWHTQGIPRGRADSPTYYHCLPWKKTRSPPLPLRTPNISHFAEVEDDSGGAAKVGLQFGTRTVKKMGRAGQLGREGGLIDRCRGNQGNTKIRMPVGEPRVEARVEIGLAWAYLMNCNSRLPNTNNYNDRNPIYPKNSEPRKKLNHLLISNKEFSQH